MILKELRETAGYTQEDMAEKLDVVVSHYNMMENGKRKISLDFAKKIADIFGKSIDEIFFADNFHNMTNKEQAS